MSDSNVLSDQKTPWHLWFIGIVSLLWNAMGAFDYLMTQTQNEEYMAQFSPEELEFFYGFPIWINSAWAIAVWSGVLGSICLMLRKKWAEPVFLVSFLAMTITAIHNYGLSNGLEVAGDTFSIVFTAAIFAVCALLWLYSRTMSSKGILG